MTQSEIPSVPDEWHDDGLNSTFHFNEEGDFVDQEGKKPVKGFKNDDNFSDWLHAWVQNKLIEKGLVISHVGNENGAPIFHTPHAFENPKKLLVLCCGSGRIHSGIWSVGVCAFHGLKNGSVLPCVEDAQKRGMEVVILNPNDSRSRILSNRFREFGMISHSLAVFEDFIIPGKPSNIYIICHSMGGECILSAIEKWPEFSINSIRAVAMTDACESLIRSENWKIEKWCKNHCINWVCSSAPLNEPLCNGTSSIHRSAGTKDHPLSTGKAYDCIWKFFDDNFADKNVPQIDIREYMVHSI